MKILKHQNASHHSSLHEVIVAQYKTCEHIGGGHLAQDMVPSWKLTTTFYPPPPSRCLMFNVEGSDNPQ